MAAQGGGMARDLINELRERLARAPWSARVLEVASQPS